MGNYLTVCEVDTNLLSQSEFLKYCEKHWGKLVVEENFKDWEDYALNIYNDLIDRSYISSYAGDICGGIVNFLEDYIKTKKSKTIVDHEEFNSDDTILVISNKGNKNEK